MGFWNLKKRSADVDEVKTVSIEESITKGISVTPADQAAILEEFNEQFVQIIGSGATFSFGGGYSNTARIAAFVGIPEVNAILNLRARAAGNIRIVAVDKNGHEIDVDDYLIDLIEEPNYFQTKEELFGQTTLFRDIFGDEFMYAPKPLGMKQPSGLFTLPPHGVTIEQRAGVQPSNMPFYLLTSFPKELVYTYQDFGGDRKLLNIDNLMHLNDNNVTFVSKEDFYRGRSKLDALKPAIENIKAAYEARNVLIVNRGAIGILSNAARDGIGGVAPMNKTEKEKVQEEFKKYGLTKSQWQVIITNLALKWQQMAIDVDKLKLFDETREDTLKICDAYGTPYELLSSIRNTTFDNKKEAQRQWYRDTIIPEANRRIAGINKKFATYDRKGYRLVPKFDHLPIFETERKERAQSLMLTVNALTKALEDGAIDIEQYKLELKKFGI